jgi:hypothetical protein
MKDCAEAHEGVESLPRWIAEGFWYLATSVRDWSSHANFPRTFEASYYASAYQRLDDLAYWLFRGESPHVSEHNWEPL